MICDDLFGRKKRVEAVKPSLPNTTMVAIIPVAVCQHAHRFLGLLVQAMEGQLCSGIGRSDSLFS